MGSSFKRLRAGEPICVREGPVSDLSDRTFSMPLSTVLAGRHSVRNFQPSKVDRRTIQRLLQAAVHAPTAIDQEPWAFAVV